MSVLNPEQSPSFLEKESEYPGFASRYRQHLDWTPSETGTYRYQRTSTGTGAWKKTGIVEHYTAYRRPKGTQEHIRAFRDARKLPNGVLLRVDTWSEAGEITHLHLALGQDDDQLTTAVLCEIEPTSVQVTRVRPGLQHQEERIPLPKSRHWLPLTRNFLGPVICCLAKESAGRGTVIVPDLRDPNAQDVLTPLVQTREAKLLNIAPQQLSIEGQSSRAEAYRFIGGPYDAKSCFWICGKSQRLLRYEFVTPSGEKWSGALSELQTP